jgi:hypothetical protein
MIETVLENAIRNRRCLIGVYEGTVRRFAPHALGATSKGWPAVFAFQYGGASGSELPRGGQWRCFHLDALSHVTENDDPWRTRGNYSLSHQSCLARIDVAVPPSTNGYK